MARTKPLKILVDTNIWIDYYTGRDMPSGAASKVIKELICSEHHVFAASLSVKDVFFLLKAYLKLAYRQEKKEPISEAQALAIGEVAWKSIEHMSRVVEVVSVGVEEHDRALELREVHSDYEDDLILACAEACEANYLLTNDASLRSHSSVTALSAEDLLRELF